MKLTLLGTGTGVPSSRRNPPCILVRLGDKRAILDSGPGALRQLLKAGVDFLSLDIIFYTHLHLDHVSDFAALLFAAKIPPTIRTKPLSVYGPRGLKDYYEKLKDLYDKTICTDAYKLELEDIENKKIAIGGFTVSTKTLRHHGGSMGYKIVTPKGRVMVYSGDTDYCDEIIEFSKDADILISECSFPDTLKMEGHLTPATAGKVARQANVKKLVFVHMYPICDEHDLIGPCKKEFSGEVFVGEDMMEFQLE